MKKVTYADMLFTLMHGKNQIKTVEKVACALMLFSGEKKKKNLKERLVFL
ncbi:hypothetical protein [Thiolapillus sp.]